MMKEKRLELIIGIIEMIATIGLGVNTIILLIIQNTWTYEESSNFEPTPKSDIFTIIYYNPFIRVVYLVGSILMVSCVIYRVLRFSNNTKRVNSEIRDLAKDGYAVYLDDQLVEHPEQSVGLFDANRVTIDHQKKSVYLYYKRKYYNTEDEIKKLQTYFRLQYQGSLFQDIIDREKNIRLRKYLVEYKETFLNPIFKEFQDINIDIENPDVRDIDMAMTRITFKYHEKKDFRIWYDNTYKNMKHHWN